MTNWWRPIAVVALAALTIVSMLTLALLIRSRNSIVCAQADLTLSSEQYGRIRRGKTCAMGEFAVAISNDIPSQPLFVLLQSGALRITIDSGTTVFFNADGKSDNLVVTDSAIALVDVGKSRTLFDLVHPKSGRSSVSYNAFDPSTGAWIDNTDVGPDGNMDLRMTEIPGRSKKTEFRVGDRWLERVDRDGQVGTILDGRFMSVTDARAKLESRASSRPIGK